jgi:vacuolar protein sorting-associated protein 33A
MLREFLLISVVHGAGGKKIYGLNSGDAVFREIRDRMYVGARRWLNDTLRTIQQFRDAGMRQADIPTLKGFVSELKDKFARLPLHTSLVDRLAAEMSTPSFLARQRAEAGTLDGGDELAVVEELVCSGERLEHALRLLCLHSAVHGSLPRRQWEALQRDVLNAYGHGHLLTLGALGRAGLLGRKDGGNSNRKGGFAAAKAAFGLLLEEGEAVQEEDPKDIHFAYAGYAPLSVRLVQQAVGPGGGWAAAEAALSALPGPHFELVQGFDDAGAPTERRDDSSSGSGGGGRAGGAADGRRKTVLAVFIGGVTCAEVSALRFLSRKGLVDAEFVIATTKVVSGNSLVGSLVPEEARGRGLGAGPAGAGSAAGGG